MKKIWVLPLLAVMLFSSCKERYSEGEKVGNTSGEPFSFSFDNDRQDQDSLINLLYQAQAEGWKVKIKYHEVWGFLNIFANRGETDYFVDDVYVIDKDFANAAKRFMGERSGQVIDTIYVVIDKNEVRQQIQNK